MTERQVEFFDGMLNCKNSAPAEKLEESHIVYVHIQELMKIIGNLTREEYLGVFEYAFAALEYRDQMIELTEIKRLEREK